MSPPPAIENDLLCGYCPGEHARPVAELVELEYAEWAVPDDRPGLRNDVGNRSSRCRPDVEDHFVFADRTGSPDLCACRRREFAADHDVGRDRNADAARLRVREQAPCNAGHVGLVQGLADGHSGRCQESIRYAAADHELVDFREQVLEHRELGRYLGSADDRDERPRRLVQRALERIELAGEQRPGAGHGRLERDAVRARFRSMRSPERVHDEHVAERRHPLRELRVVLLLPLQEPDVLEQGDFAWRGVGIVELAIDETHGPIEQGRKRLGDRRERQRGIALPFLRTAEMRHHEHAGALPDRMAQRREGRSQACVARDSCRRQSGR